jgi:hypothetical protein
MILPVELRKSCQERPQVVELRAHEAQQLLTRHELGYCCVLIIAPDPVLRQAVRLTFCRAAFFGHRWWPALGSVRRRSSIAPLGPRAQPGPRWFRAYLRQVVVGLAELQPATTRLERDRMPRRLETRADGCVPGVAALAEEI